MRIENIILTINTMISIEISNHQYFLILGTKQRLFFSICDRRDIRIRRKKTFPWCTRQSFRDTGP